MRSFSHTNPTEMCEPFRSDSGDYVVLACEHVFYVLKYNMDAVSAHFASNGSTTDGVDDAFEVLHEIPEKVQWF